jgi:PAS domain S-box-containing protein
VALAFVVVLLLVAGTLAAFLYASREADTAESSVQRGELLNERAAAALKLVLDAETAMRGYVITGREEFLEPYRAAERERAPALRALRREARGTEETAAAERLGRSIDDYFARFARSQVELAATRPGRAREVVLSGSGKRRVDAIRAQSAALDRLVHMATERARSHAHSVRSTARAVGIGGLAAAVVMFLGLAVYFASRVLLPLRLIADAVRRLGSGERGVHVPVPAGSSEIAVLAAAFNEMSAALEQAHADVRRSAVELTKFFELTPELLCIADGDGYLRRTSAHYSRALGYSAEELATMPIVDLVHPEDREASLAELARLGEGEESVSFEDRYRRRDGTLVWLRWNAALAEDGLIYAAGSDISDRRAAEERLREATAEAERANHAKSEFLSRMSHELRTPLNSILGFSQLMQMDGLRDDQVEHIGHVVRSGKHLLALINEVLDLSRVEAGKLSISTEPVDVGAAIEDAVASLHPAAVERAARLSVGRRVAGLYVSADHQRLRQILLNLLSNAIKYGGGEVVVDVDEGPGDTVTVSVRDNGPGIPADQLPGLFTPFERLHAEGGEEEGTGLGLALSQRLAELMRGSIQVQSEPGTGTTFALTLPRGAPPGLADHEGRDGVGANPEPTGFRVLYVEDNLANLRLVEAIVSRRGGEVVSAPDGRTGMALARIERPDLILLDVHLPDLSGLEVLGGLKGDPTTRQIPIVVLTADATDGARRRATRLGADAFLTKPLDIDALLDTIDGLLPR